MIIYFKDNKKKEKIINIHGMQNRETLVALADNYIEVNKTINIFFVLNTYTQLLTMPKDW